MADNCDVLIFFGATGDLAFKKIFPALASMIRHGTLNIPIIGVAKEGWDLDRFLVRARSSLEASSPDNLSVFPQLRILLRYVDGDYNDPATYTRLRREMGDAQHPLHYLAIPPDMFTTVARGLAGANCTAGARIIVEKPFGRDLASAQALNATLRQFFPEPAIHRIDHYLGKEPVQNLLYSRFANMLYEPIWNRNYISCIQITMAEQFGVQGRGKLYDELGAIRDVLQNHMMQLVACLAMEPPAGSHGEAIRDERAKLLRMVRTLSPDDVVRGQFRGYQKEHGVASNSTVETFAAVRLWVDSWRWAGVPFFIRVGKSLPITCTEVLVEFKRPPQKIFPDTDPGARNQFRFRLSPEVIVAIAQRSKIPGEAMVGQDVELIATHTAHDEMEPYERLLHEAMREETAYFAREDGVEEAWRIVDPVLGDAAKVHPYDPGTWGPPEANGLIAGYCPWHTPAPSPPRS